VTHDGAFKDEMAMRRKSYADDALLAAFGRAARSTLIEKHDPTATEALVARLAGIAREQAVAGAPVRLRSVRSRKRRVLVAAAAAVLSVPVLTAGLAFAGVELPSPARSVFESSGIDLPNQTDSDDEPASPSGDDGAQDTAPSRTTPSSESTDESQKARGKSNNAPRQRGSERDRRRVVPAPSERGISPGESESTGKSKQGGAPSGKSKQVKRLKTAPGRQKPAKGQRQKKKATGAPDEAPAGVPRVRKPKPEK
jgi:hypothetical protein